MSRRPTDIVSLQVRMREGLRRKIEKAATANDQSNNSEIVARLEASFDEEEREGDFRAAIATLTGGARNARLISMLASALNTITIEWDDVEGIGRMEAMNRFLTAAAAIVRADVIEAMGSKSPRQLKISEVRHDETEYGGLLVAQRVLKHYKLHPPLDEEGIPIDELPSPDEQNSE